MKITVNLIVTKTELAQAYGFYEKFITESQSQLKGNFGGERIGCREINRA